jgi:hypothetical protein
MMVKLKKLITAKKKSADGSKKRSATNSKTRVSKIKQAPAENCFWINNGPVIGNLLDLYDALGKIDDAQFKYHTARSGNDFAIWISEVICEPGLSKKVSKIKSREAMRKVIRTHLK